MEIDNEIIELMRTCLKEEWGANEVSDEQVKMMVEMTLVVAVFHDIDRYDLPVTTEAMAKYLMGKGIPLEDDEFEEGDSDATEKREVEGELKEAPHTEEDA